MQFPHECRDVTICWRLYCFCLLGSVESPALSGTPFCKGGSLPGSGACRARSLPECCRRSLTYGYGRLRLSDAGVGGNLFLISERFVSPVLANFGLPFFCYSFIKSASVTSLLMSPE